MHLPNLSRCFLRNCWRESLKGESLGRYAQPVLAQRGVELRLNTLVTSMTENEICLSQGAPIPSSNLIWTAGTFAQSPAFFAAMPERTRPGSGERVPANRRLARHLSGGRLCDRARPQTSRKVSSAHRPTRHSRGPGCGAEYRAGLAGHPPKPFSFKTIGLLASIGRRPGVARVFGLNFSGFFAWWLWRTIYLGKLPGLDKKVRVAFDWTLDLLFGKDVCAVHDLPSRADVHPREHSQAPVGDDRQYERTAEVEATLVN